ncbi:hypothetical protein J6590_097826 [Homalodisca vitripennis]|nr:hypothetical protein J6590_097826 [Homalodisca vitripennis]
MAAGGRKDDVCGVCVNKVTKRTGGVKCNGFCNKWYHIKCTTLSSEDFKKFLDLSGKVMWYCEPCKVKVNELVLSGDSSTENVQAESENGCLNPHLKLILDQLDIVSENYSKLEERMTLVEKVSNRNVNLSTQGSICDEAGECTDMSGSEGISNAVALDNNVGVDIESNDNSDNSLSDKADVTSEAAGSRRPSGGAIRVVNGQRVINNSEWKVVNHKKKPVTARYMPSYNQYEMRKPRPNGGYVEQGKPRLRNNSTNVPLTKGRPMHENSL